MHELVKHHAHVWIGNQDMLVARAIQALQELWCPHNACGKCSVCKRIVEKQFHHLLWLTPAKQSYTVDQIDELHAHLSLQREPDEHFFVVLELAHTLSAASANKLLKTLEEPPAGYHFLLLSESRFGLLPTIVSRCLITHYGSEHSDDAGLLLFIDRIVSPDFDLQTAFQNVASLHIDESKTRAVIDVLLHRLIKQYQECLASGDDADALRIQKRIDLTNQQYSHLPMPGSTNAFWRMLLLKMLCA